MCIYLLTLSSRGAMYPPIYKNAPNHEEWAGHVKDERAPRDYKESWAPKNWCFWTVVLEKTLESPLHCKEIQPVHTKGNQSRIFIGRTDAEAETPILWPPDVKTDSLEKTLMLGKIEGRRRSGWQRMRWLDGMTTQWTWVWVNSGDWWWTGRPGVLQFMGSQRVGHEWATELNWTEG